MVIAVASPRRFRIRRLARLLEHELRHVLGEVHEEMPERVEWVLGGVPTWAARFDPEQGGRALRYVGRAPNQMGSTPRAIYGTLFDSTRK